MKLEPGLDEKSRLRREARERRDNLAEPYRSEAGERILESLRSLPDYQAVQLICLYCGFGSEPDTLSWAARFMRDGKTVAFPRIGGDGRMDFYRVDDFEELVPGFMGIREPSGECEAVEPGVTDWIIVPGLLFDRDGHRIGYGGGYYDRYLARYPMVPTIGAVYAAALYPGRLPRDITDLPVGRVITEREDAG